MHSKATKVLRARPANVSGKRTVRSPRHATPGPPLRVAKRAKAGAETSAQYYALVVPGLEDIAAAELKGAGATVTETISRVDKRDGFVLFRTDDVDAALRCGTLEDVFQVVLDASSPPARGAPRQAARGLERAAIERALLTHNALRPGKRGRSYKVVARVAGQHPFRREDVEHAFARALDGMLAKWVPARDRAALELWVHVIGPPPAARPRGPRPAPSRPPATRAKPGPRRIIAGVRLSDDTLAQRAWKQAHLPASLKPTVARALVRLADLRRGEAVADPMCGAGTILREAAESSWGLTLLGGDIDPTALAAATVNAGKQASLAWWDACQLPLGDRTVDAVVTNPPYGRQHEVVAGLDRLYRRLTRECARVLRPGGRAVVLTGEPTTLLEALPKNLRVRSKRRLLLRGLPVTAFVIVRE